MINVVDFPVPAAAPVGVKGARLVGLRSLLAEKFPAVETKESGVLPTGHAAFDGPEGGLRRGRLTEITGSLGAGPLFLELLLTILAREKCFAALIDGGHSFSPEDYSPDALARLLWVFCREAGQAIKSADLLLRDGNLALVVLDLQWLAPRDLQRIPASTWHRFQRVVEKTDAVFAVISPRPMIEGAAVRIAVRNQWDLRAMRCCRSKLMSELEVQIFSRTTQAPPVWSRRSA